MYIELYCSPQGSFIEPGGWMLLSWVFSNVLWYANSCINFYLYCLCNVQIRKKVPEQSSHDFCISVSLSTCQVLSWFKKLSPSQKKVRTISGRLGKEEDGRNSLLQ